MVKRDFLFFIMGHEFQSLSYSPLSVTDLVMDPYVFREFHKKPTYLFIFRRSNYELEVFRELYVNVNCNI